MGQVRKPEHPVKCHNMSSSKPTAPSVQAVLAALSSPCRKYQALEVENYQLLCAQRRLRRLTCGSGLSRRAMSRFIVLLDVCISCCLCYCYRGRPSMEMHQQGVGEGDDEGNGMMKTGNWKSQGVLSLGIGNWNYQTVHLHGSEKTTLLCFVFCGFDLSFLVLLSSHAPSKSFPAPRNLAFQWRRRGFVACVCCATSSSYRLCGTIDRLVAQAVSKARERVIE